MRYTAQPPVHPAYACEEGVLLLRLWADSEPEIVALLPRLTRADLDDAMLSLNTTWRVYTAHISQCPECSRYSGIAFHTALIDITLFD